MPVHSYSAWHKRPADQTEQIDTYKKYIFICEGANTERFYFRRLIDQKKQLRIHPLIEMCLWEKTDADKDISFPKNLVAFANRQKLNPENDFDPDRDVMVVVFDGDIFEEKVQGYDELITSVEESDIAAVTNPGFELFLILHIKDSYELFIKGHESEYLTIDQNGSYSHAYKILHQLTGMNAKKNPKIGELADNVLVAIEQEKNINQDIHRLKGQVSSNIGKIIESIINENPDPAR